jgi:hypothetical protein
MYRFSANNVNCPGGQQISLSREQFPRRNQRKPDRAAEDNLVLSRILNAPERLLLRSRGIQEGCLRLPGITLAAWDTRHGVRYGGGFKLFETPAAWDIRDECVKIVPLRRGASDRKPPPIYGT